MKMPYVAIEPTMYPTEWRDLPGTIRVVATDQHADDFMRNALAILVEHDLGPGWPTYAGWIQCNRLAWDDGAFVRMAIIESLDRYVRPWLRPDRYQWPTFDLFPRVARLEGWWAQSEIRWRLRWRR